MIRWPDFLPEQRRAQVLVEWYGAKGLFNKLKHNPTVPIQTLLLGCGLAPVLVFLKIVRVMIEGRPTLAGISFDQIRSAKDRLLVDFVREAWNEIGFDGEGRDLPLPVTEPALTLWRESLAQIQELPVNEEIEQELRAIAGLLAGEPATSDAIPATRVPMLIESEAADSVAKTDPNIPVGSNRKAVEDLQSRVLQDYGVEISKQQISLVAGYKNIDQLMRLQRDDDGKERPRKNRVSRKAIQKFKRVVMMSSTQFLRNLVEKDPELKDKHPNLMKALNESDPPAGPRKKH
jgi:hypothetical protein